MRISEVYPSNYPEPTQPASVVPKWLDPFLLLCCAKLRIQDCRPEDRDGETVPVLYFRSKLFNNQIGPTAFLGLNRINGEILVESLGDETRDWVGREIELYLDKTQYTELQPLTHERFLACLRVRVPAAAARNADEDLPF